MVVRSGDALLTRASLIARLGDPEDRAAWQEFVELYGGLVYGFARKRGLQDADAADLTQEVFLAVARAAGAAATRAGAPPARRRSASPPAGGWGCPRGWCHRGAAARSARPRPPRG